MSEGALKDIFKRLREETGLVENQPLTVSVKLGAYRSEIMTCHGFRKYFATTIKGNGMDKTYSEMVMGHDIGLESNDITNRLNELGILINIASIVN
jgi:integrase